MDQAERQNLPATSTSEKIAVIHRKIVCGPARFLRQTKDTSEPDSNFKTQSSNTIVRLRRGKKTMLTLRAENRWPKCVMPKQT